EPKTMKIRAIIGSAAAVTLMGVGILVGSTVGTGGVSAQTSTTTPPAQTTSPPAQTTKANITKQQAEQAALAASPGNTVDHTRLGNDNGTAIYDVDFTNGGGVVVNAQTGAIIATEAAGTDKGGHMGGGPDQAALAAKATV